MRQSVLTATICRRSLIGGMVAPGGAALVGCGPSETQPSAEPQAPQSSSPATSAQLASMVVYRDPSCGCCEAWAELARKAGYPVTLIDRPDMPAIKHKYGVPEKLLSCHTAVVGNYAVEGHVPLEDVGRLLAERPAGVRGIAVVGMPRGSPGMEKPDGARDAFQVMAYDGAGQASVFRA